MGKPLELFDFEASEPEALPLELTAEYLQGFEAGKADATETLHRQQNVLGAELAAAITDIEFGYTEARLQLLEDITPLLSAICSQLLPALSDQMLQSHLFKALTEVAKTRCDSAIALSLHPQNVTTVQAALAAQSFDRVTIAPDPDLGPLEARWRTLNSEDAIDLASLVATIRNALHTITDESERKASHG